MLESESRFGVTDAHTNRYFTGVTMSNTMKDVGTTPGRHSELWKKRGLWEGGGTQTWVNRPSTN